MKKIKLYGKVGHGKFTIVDDENYEWLNQWRWHCEKTGYAARSAIDKSGKKTLIRMHRFILDTPKGMESDHKDLNKLNNQRYNLRICTTAQNQQNQKIKKGGTSKYKGVYWFKEKNNWCVQIKNNGNQVFIGRYDSEIEAAKKYDEKAKELFGEFARLNFPQKPNLSRLKKCPTLTAGRITPNAGR